MTNGASGFTLIELLVVVLIIGILAAVALPQYQQAVNKARFANLRSTANTLAKSSEAYFLANNEWPTDLDTLAIDLPAGMTTSAVGGGTCGVNNDIYCCLINATDIWSPAIVCGRNDYSFAFHTFSRRTNPQWSSYCVAEPTDTNAVKLCKTFGVNNGDWTMFTPDGAKHGDYYSVD